MRWDSLPPSRSEPTSRSPETSSGKVEAEGA